MKTTIWIIGSNASGKTTQAKILHRKLGTDKKVITKGFENEVMFKYTTFGETVSNVGEVQANQCTGTDSLQTKAQIQLSYEKALENSNLVIVDGIMATGQWIKFIKKPDVKVLIVLLDFSTPEDNLGRVKKRRALKLGIDVDEVEMTEVTEKNVWSKRGVFYRLFNNMKDLCDHSIAINACASPKDINDKIILELSKLL